MCRKVLAYCPTTIVDNARGQRLKALSSLTYPSLRLPIWVWYGSRRSRRIGAKASDMAVKNFFRWASHSLGGHIVLFELVLSLSLFIVFLAQKLADGDITLGWVLWALFVTASIGAIAAILAWFTITRGLIDRTRNRRE